MKQGVQVQHAQRADGDLEASFVAQPRDTGLFVGTNGLLDTGSANLVRDRLVIF